MSSLGDELSFGSITRKVSKNVAMEKDFKYEEYVKKLEEEKRKIERCGLELPLSLQMLNNAISYVKEEKKRCSEMDTRPLLKDFMSLSKPIREEVGVDKREERKFPLREANDHISSRSLADPNFKNRLEIERNDENPSNDGFSMLLMRTPKVETGLGLGLTSSAMVDEGRKGQVVASCGFTTTNFVPQPPPFLQQQALRKQRRCWTPALHRRFVDALEQLGGHGAATPKQIREHMNEEGLTNDEVKSHLQKYRLHIRKLNPEKQSVVVLGFNLRNSSEGEGEGSSKRSNSQSDSPQGPLQLPSITTTTGGDSSMEDAEDSKSESFQMDRVRSP